MPLMLEVMLELRMNTPHQIMRMPLPSLENVSLVRDLRVMVRLLNNTRKEDRGNLVTNSVKLHRKTESRMFLKEEKLQKFDSEYRQYALN